MASLGLLGALAGAGRGVEDYGKGRMSMALEDIKAERLAQAAEAERGFRREERQAEQAFTTSRDERGFEVEATEAELARKHDLTRDSAKARSDIALERAKVSSKAGGNPYDKDMRNDLIDVQTEYDRRMQALQERANAEAWDEQAWKDERAVVDAWRTEAEKRVQNTWGGGQRAAAGGGDGSGGGARIPPGTTKTINGTAYIMKADGWHVDDGTTQDGPRKGRGEPEPEASARPAPEEPSDYIKGVEERSRPAARGGLIAGAQAATNEPPAQGGQAQPMAERLRAMRAEKRPAEAARERLEAEAAKPVAAFEERFRELFGALSKGRDDPARTQALLDEARELLEAAPNDARRRALEKIIADLSA